MKEKHIVFCGDDNFVIPICIMLESLTENNRDRRFIAHTFGDNLSEGSLARLESVLKRSDSKLIIHTLPKGVSELLDNAPTQEHISITTYYRLFIPYVIGDDVDEVLYLDGDVLVCGKIDELFDRKIDNAVLAGVPDLNEADNVKRTGVDVYVNAGVLIIYVSAIRKMYSIEEMIGKIREYLAVPGKIIYGDQDIMNILYEGYIDKISDIYNFQRVMNKGWCLKHISYLKKVIVVHFITGDKPWNYDYSFIFAGRYYKYLKKYLKRSQRILWHLGKIVGFFKLIKKHIGWSLSKKRQDIG